MDREDRSSVPAAVYVVAAAVVALLLIVSSRYGFHRDELYFVAAGRRLAWGFVDQPPLTPLIARMGDLLPGTVGPIVLRIVPALSAGGVAVLTGVLARRFGGGRAAIVAAALFAGIAGFFLGVGHLLSTTTFDVLIWVVVIVLVAALIDHADPRLWLGVGAAVGTGMLNKFTVAALVIGLGVGLLLTPQRRILRTPWLAGGIGLAVLIASPTLLWQASNGWPQLEMSRAISGRDGPADYAFIQIAIVSLFLIVPAVAGWWWLMFGAGGKQWRTIPIAFVFLFVVFLVAGGKGYYVAPLYLPLFAAGALWFEGLTIGKRRTMGALIAAGAVLGLFLALPVVSPASVGPFNGVNGELGETYAWSELVDQVEAVYLTIPIALRDEVVVFTSNYGQAGAIEIIGEGRLPQPISGHNSYWSWGTSESMGPIVGVGWVGDALRSICPRVDRVGSITNPANLENDEFGTALWLCMEPTAPLAEIWSDVRHYD
jgi:4-amino-4-deoxy-L-arabinose transferase-like glycosyltransferase